MADNYQEIIGEGAILRMLDRIRAHRSLIHIRVSNKGSPSSSAIIAVDMEKRTWQFDELPSDEANRSLLKERKCGIEARLDGVTIKFQTEVTEFGSDAEGLFYYQASPPRSLRVYQRRASYRASLSTSQRATVSFSIPGVTVMRGRIRDISLGGLGVTFSNWTQLIEKGLQINNASVALPNGKAIYCGLKVCFANRSSGGMSMGARFIDISRSDQREISRCVAALDRENAKRAHSAEKYDSSRQNEEASGAASSATQPSKPGGLMFLLMKLREKIGSRRN